MSRACFHIWKTRLGLCLLRLDAQISEIPCSELKRFCSGFNAGIPSHYYTTASDDIYRVFVPNDSYCGPFDETPSKYSRSVFIANINFPPYTTPLIEMMKPGNPRFSYVSHSSDYTYLTGKGFKEVRVVGYILSTLGIKNTSTLYHFFRTPGDPDTTRDTDDVIADPNESGYLINDPHYKYHNTSVTYFKTQSKSGYCFITPSKCACSAA